MKNKISKIKITKIQILLILIIVLVLSLILIIVPKGASISKYNSFASCLKEKKAVFYGASWCPHCRAEKRLFGSAEKLLPYVECSTSAGGQTQECKDKKIMGYPTWEFSDGSRINGEATLQMLSDKTSCALPIK